MLRSKGPLMAKGEQSAVFSEMGFKGLELEARTRSFVLTMSSENAFLKTVKPADQKKLLKAQFAFFTRP